MKTIKKNWITIIGIGGTALMLATALTTPAQTTPALAIAPVATNQISITITNGISSDYYEIWWTPVLGSGDYLWTMAPPGTIGQTNFLLENWGYPAVFFRGVLDTNTVPLWQQSNPNNPPSPILTITIASPANGANLNQ